MGQAESESISQNVTWGKRRSFKDGKVTFQYSRFLGYEKGEDGQPKIVPEQAEIVKRIFYSYLSGYSANKIKKELESEGVISATGKPEWSIHTIQYMLAALDMRIIDPTLPDYPDSKVNLCVDNVFRIWDESREKKLTQVIFCDLSTPKKSVFNVYDDIKQKLIKQGVPENEISFIHDANSDSQKAALFSAVRRGEIRILLGSSAKCGAGTNVQNKLVAIHDLDCPWTPKDLEQRAGRILRQGNDNEEVGIYRYVTKESFDL